MPQVLDISNARKSNSGSGSSPGSKKTSGKPKRPPGPKPTLIIGVSAAVVVSLLILGWFFLRPSADSHMAVPYSPSTRNLNGPPNSPAGPGNGGANVAPGLPGDGG